VTARVLSSMRSERLAAAARLEGPAGSAHLDPESFVKTLAGALEAGLLTTYAQGMALIAAAAMAHGWPIELAEVARIWTGGSILRAHLLEDVVAAFTRAPDLPNAMLDETIRSRLCDTQGKLRQAVQQAQRHGIPAPVLGASLAYYDSYRAEQLPQNLTQAQRDAFGAHGYRRKDDPEGAPLYGDWLD
jgi:6-phosphogluconate dehydrogenase